MGAMHRKLNVTEQAFPWCRLRSACKSSMLTPRWWSPESIFAAEDPRNSPSKSVVVFYCAIQRASLQLVMSFLSHSSTNRTAYLQAVVNEYAEQPFAKPGEVKLLCKADLSALNKCKNTYKEL